MTSQPQDSSQSQEPNQEKGIRQWLPKSWYGRALMPVWLLFALLPGGWWVGGLLFVLQILALRYLNAREDTRQSWQEKFFKRIFDISAIVVVFVLTIALGSWVVVNFIWGQRYERQHTVAVLTGDVFVTVTLPGFVPVNGDAVQGAVVVSNQTDVTQTVTMTLAAGPHLILPEGPTLSVTVGGGKVVSRSLAVVSRNRDPYPRFGREEGVTVTAVAGTTGDPQTIDVYVQGNLEAGLYAFVTTAVNKASPLLIIVAFLVPLLGAVLQKYAEKFQAEQEKKSLEKKEQEEKLAQKLVEQFQYYICMEDVEKAEEQLGRNNWPDGMLEDARETGNSLIKLAKLDGLGEDGKITDELKKLIQNGSVWPDACLAAYTLAWNQCREKDFSNECEKPLNEVRSLLPISEASQKFQNQLAQIEMEILGREKTKYIFKPILDWPRLPPKPYLAPASEWVRKTVPNGKDPFTDVKSEKNLYFLYCFQEESYLFWNGHPLFNLLFRLQEPALIFGEPGSGRTAMAYGMHFFATRREVLALHLPGTPSEEVIQKGFAAALWDFIRCYPDKLRLLTGGERRAVARLFVNYFGQESMVSLIENAHTHLFSARFGIGKKEKEKKEMQKTGGEQLLLLNEAVKSIEERKGGPWYSLVHAAMKALRFDRVYLVLDAPETAIDWVNNDIIPRLQEWQVQGLYTVLFVPSRAEPHLQLQALVRNKYYLTWNQTQFTAMLERRYQAFAGERRTIYELFEDDVLFDYMVEKCGQNGHYNPQWFMQLWQQITRQLPADRNHKINKVDIVEAVKEISALKVQTVSMGNVQEEAAQDLGYYSAVGQGMAQITVGHSKKVSQAELRNILINYFDREELRDICFDYDIDYEKFDQNKRELIREMINEFARIGRREQLVEEICRRRPNVDICTDSHT
ncbi:MAG: hypothetical protein Kow0080_24270 [Candidatus Promineifilaceae bacterium]